MTNSEIRYKFMEYLIEKHYPNYECSADDFLSDTNKVVLAKDSDEDFFNMVCFNNAALIKAKKDIYEWFIAFISEHVGFRCFDFRQTSEICKELSKHNLFMQGGQGSLPDIKVKRTSLELPFNIRMFAQNEIMSIYHYTDKNTWHMCCPGEDDYLAFAAFDGDRIIGMSSTSSEKDILYSFDIEVLPQYRQKGVAATLVTEMTNTLLDKGLIPFATSAWSNNASNATLYRCGYYPAWSYISSYVKE